MCGGGLIQIMTLLVFIHIFGLQNFTLPGSLFYAHFRVRLFEVHFVAENDCWGQCKTVYIIIGMEQLLRRGNLNLAQKVVFEGVKRDVRFVLLS